MVKRLIGVDLSIADGEVLLSSSNRWCALVAANYILRLNTCPEAMTLAAANPSATLSAESLDVMALSPSTRCACDLRRGGRVPRKTHRHGTAGEGAVMCGGFKGSGWVSCHAQGTYPRRPAWDTARALVRLHTQCLHHV